MNKGVPNLANTKSQSVFEFAPFEVRHLGSTGGDEAAMCAAIGCASREALIGETVPKDIVLDQPLSLPAPLSEHEALQHLAALAARNKVWRSFIGTGYYGTHVPSVIQRNVLENPGWYTAYTPYQAEISQGRLEALLNFQHMVIDLTGLPVANASLLDEATAAAEAMTLMWHAAKDQRTAFLVDTHCHPQVIAVMRTRGAWLGIDVVVADAATQWNGVRFFGIHVQYPNTRGSILELGSLAAQAHAANALMSVGTDLLALMLLKSPGELGADVAVGSAQRFGVPLGYGGPHAAFMAVREDLKRVMPGRIIGVTKDAAGKLTYRMALQTREQHIRREKATSNICTAQALLANMAAFYAIYHGPQGLMRIARRTHAMARALRAGVEDHLEVSPGPYFDTLTVRPNDAIQVIQQRATKSKINLRYLENAEISVSLDETTTLDDVCDLVAVLTGRTVSAKSLTEHLEAQLGGIPLSMLRVTPVLSHPVFNSYHTETEMMRYLKRLENRDLSLVHSMIPLGSCTMKLNAATELAPLSWPEFSNIHPFAPREQATGYHAVISGLGDMLKAITGFSAVSFQPNSGAQGEYAGLLAIRNYHRSRGEAHRNVCLIPTSAHGTNPASAAMMGLQIVLVQCDDDGNVDVEDLRTKASTHRKQLCALMVTYPSTHGVFETSIRQICQIVHEAGAQVYMDGANLNALAGLAQPSQIGADVCHINLHKTFCIPHGGGGPGMGPIAVAAHLAPFLPGHPCSDDQATLANGSVSAAPHGSALILLISWMYIRMMGARGVRRATELAILNANYIATRLKSAFPVLYVGANGRVAHECILDLRHLKATCGITAEDVAKRLMDYGFHAPTLSFPVADTLMVEPTESESKHELDRFCDAMLSIAAEIERVKAGEWSKTDNPLKNAPHTAEELTGDWAHPYSREVAVYPRPWLREAKYWPPVKRADNVAGDRNLICTCPPVETYA